MGRLQSPWASSDNKPMRAGSHPREAPTWSEFSARAASRDCRLLTSRSQRGRGCGGVTGSGGLGRQQGRQGGAPEGSLGCRRRGVRSDGGSRLDCATCQPMRAESRAWSRGERSSPDLDVC